MVKTAVKGSLDIKHAQVQTIFPGKSIHFEFDYVEKGVSPKKCLEQLVARARTFLRENKWTFDGITVKEGSLSFKRAKVEDFDDEKCWLEVPFGKLAVNGHDPV